MDTSIISGDDVRYFVQQPPEALTTIIGQMTSLIQGISEVQNDTNERVEAIEKQNWFKRMWATVSGKNKASKIEIQRNQDKIVTYISEAVAQLYQMNCIDQQIMCSLGNRMNQVYAQVTEVYNEQLQMKAQIAEVMALQQQTLQAMGDFVTKLNEKIESVDNFHMLITEIQQGQYADTSKLYSLCSVLAQLDKRVLEDERKLDILRNALVQSQIVDENGISVQNYLMDILALPDSKVGIVYMELCNFRESFPANLFAEMIETYHFLPKMEKMSKKKELLIQKLLEKYELDADAEFSLADVSVSFIENKQNSIVDIIQLQFDGNEIDFDDDSEIVDDSIEADELIRLANDGDCEMMAVLGTAYLVGEEDENVGVKGIAQNVEDGLTFLKRAAEQGNAKAQNNLGSCYGNGLGVEQDYTKAVEWYRKAAEQEFAAAQFHLGCCYENGLGVEQDYTKAVEWYRKAAEQGAADAQYILGCVYEEGTGVDQDYAEAVKWYRKAAEQGDVDAQYILGCAYEEGTGIEQDYAGAVKWYRKAAEQGNAKAQTNLGYCYANGTGVKQDHSEAAEWFRKAAEQGAVEAQFNLGICYENGTGVEQDYSKAAEWYRKAAEQDHPGAQTNLGYCYENGQGIKQNYSEAIKWYLKAAEQGHVAAQYNLGLCYKDGTGVNQNFSEAVKWFRKAAEQGDADAQFKLGMCYDEGTGVKQNHSEAIEWFKKAAEQGVKDAKVKLAFCYLVGNGVAQNCDKAIKLFSEIPDNNNEFTKESLGEACYHIGLEYYDGSAEDNRKAFKLIEKSYQLGYAEAYTLLADCYYEGVGCEKNKEKAIEILKQGMQLGIEECKDDYKYMMEDDIILRSKEIGRKIISFLDNF